MQQLLLVNPRKRRKKSGGRRKARRSASSYRRRRSHSVSRGVRRVARRSFRRRRRSNPISLRGVPAMLMPAFKGAAGAVATDFAYRMLPLPGALAFLKSGMLAPVTKIGVAVAVGALASMFGGRSLGREMTSGALVVIGYGLINDLVLSRLPVVGAPQTTGEYISGLGYQSAGLPLQDGSGVGEYISGMGSASFDEIDAF